MHVDNWQELPLATLFEEQVVQNPQNKAISYKNQTLTYSALNESANQLAAHLRQAGVKSDTIVAICLERSIDLLIAMLAVLKAGGAYLPLDETHPDERLQFLFADSATHYLITKGNNAERFASFNGTTIFIDGDSDVIAQHSKDNTSPITKPNNLAYLIYTSGTTGKPKGVLVEQAGIANYAQWLYQFTHLQAGQTIDFSCNPIFDMAVTVSIVPLLCGLHVFICDETTKKDLKEYLSYLKNNKIDIIKLTPSYFKILLNEVRHEIAELPDLKKIILGGEHLKSADCARWLAIYPNQIIFNEYGPTEITVAATLFKCDAHDLPSLGENVPIGKVGPNITFTLENGELYIGGIGVARGYQNLPELTETKFVTIAGKRYYKTGDTCELLPSGDLLFKGRNDDQVKIRGFRIEPAETQAYLLKHPAILEAVVVARSTQSGEMQLVAYYIPKDNQTNLSGQTLREFLLQSLSEYMVPTAFVAVESFPLNENNKLDKSALPQPMIETTAIKSPPRTELEQRVASIWAECLHVDSVGIDDNFFELGGHSLIAARIVSKIEKITGKKIRLNDVYTAGDIRELTNVINKTEVSRHIVRPQLSEKEEIPLSDFEFMFWMSNVYEPKTKKLNIAARKRIATKLDMDAFHFAVEQLLKKQKILSYEFLKTRPVQIPRENLSCKVLEKDIRHMSSKMQESTLLASMDMLINYYPWKHDAPQLLVSVFHLRDDLSEIQISMPHIIADDYSAVVIFKDLSDFYLAYKKPPSERHFEPVAQYKEYVYEEQSELNKNLEADIAFWEKYFEDTDLFPFPREQVVANLEADKQPFSTFFPLPEENLQKLRTQCAKNKINLTHALCACVALVLSKYSDEANNNKNVYFNVIRSTREDERYDDTVGCFLKLDSYKFKVSHNKSVLDMARELQAEQIQNVHHQNCSGLVKLATINRSYWRTRTFINLLINFFATAYAKIFSNLKLDVRIIKMYGRLYFFSREEKFLININMWGNFIARQNRELFGSHQVNLPFYQYDLSTINNVFDVCFLRDDADCAYLVLSGNLKPAFKEKLGKEIIELISA